MSSSKKCSACGKWSETNASSCPVCATSYERIDRKHSAASDEAMERRKKEIAFLNSGNLFQRFIKKSAWVIHLVFLGLSSLLAWWIAVFHY